VKIIENIYEVLHSSDLMLDQNRNLHIQALLSQLSNLCPNSSQLIQINVFQRLQISLSRVFENFERFSQQVEEEIRIFFGTPSFFMSMKIPIISIQNTDLKMLNKISLGLRRVDCDSDHSKIFYPLSGLHFVKSGRGVQKTDQSGNFVRILKYCRNEEF